MRISCAVLCACVLLSVRCQEESNVQNDKPEQQTSDGRTDADANEQIIAAVEVDGSLSFEEVPVLSEDPIVDAPPTASPAAPSQGDDTSSNAEGKTVTKESSSTLQPPSQQADVENVENEVKEQNIPESDVFMCRACGHELFEGVDHLHAYQPITPLIQRHIHEPQLGTKGNLMMAFTSGAASRQPSVPGQYSPQQFVPLAAFSTGLGVAIDAPSDPQRDSWSADLSSPLPSPPRPSANMAALKAAARRQGAKLEQKEKEKEKEGVVAQRVSCGACGAHIGWHFAQKPRKPVAAVTPTPTAAPAPKRRGDVIPYDAAEEEQRLAFMKQACVEHPTGWWTYVFCYRDEVRQYHRDPKSNTKESEWSLGKFATRAGGNVDVVRSSTEARQYYTSHFFKDGQLCHETNKGRQTEVQFLCCPRLERAAISAEPTIVDIKEPATCKYVLELCVPQLCQPAPEPSVTQTPPATPVEEPAQPYEDDVKGFIVALWRNIIGDASPVMQAMTDTSGATGISQVRFSSGN